MAPQSRKPSITEDLIHRRHVPSGWCWPDLQQGRGESASCAARQDAGPSPRGPRSWAVSADHLPPTSAPRTTRRALPPSPASSGYVRSFLLRAFRAAPSMVAALGRAVPSRRTGDTVEVSMVSCAPGHSVRPSATTSSLRPSNLLCCARSMSRTNTLVDTRANASRQTWGCCTLQHELPSLQNSCLCACCSMVSKSQVGGHIGRCVSTREWRGEGACREESGKIANRSSHGGWWEELCREQTATGHFGTLIRAWSTSPNSAVNWKTNPSPTRRVAFCCYPSSVGKALHQPLPLEGVHRQSVPRVCLEPCVDQSLLTRPDCSQTGCLMTFQTQHHPEAVSPTGRMSGGSLPHCTGQAQSSLNGKKAMV